MRLPLHSNAIFKEAQMSVFRIVTGLGMLWCCCLPLAAQDTSLVLYGQYANAGDLRNNIARTVDVGLRWDRCGYENTSIAADMYIAALRGVNVALTLSRPDLVETNDTTGWRTFVREAVQTYGPGGSFWTARPTLNYMPVRYFEIWNEPNMRGFLDPPAGYTLSEYYTILLRIAYEEIKAVAPSAKVVGMNVSGGVNRSWMDPELITSNLWGWYSFIKRVNELGGSQYYDIVALHPYTTCNSACGLVRSEQVSPDRSDLLGALDSLRGHLARYGNEDYPIWYSEVGFAIESPNVQPMTEQEQAERLVKLHVLATAGHVEHIEIMYVVDITYSPDGTMRRFGLFDGTRYRPQALALQYMIRELPDPNRAFRGAVALGAGKYAYAFRQADSTLVIVYWSETQTGGTVQIPVQGVRAELVDMLGAAVPAVITSNSVTVPISVAPQYVKAYLTASAVRRPAGPAAELARWFDITPNPHMAGTRMTFTCRADGATPTELTLSDLTGRTVHTLAMAKDGRSFVWDGRDMHGHSVPSGIYCCAINSANGPIQQYFVIVDR
jgi:hypothetical protein